MFDEKKNCLEKVKAQIFYILTMICIGHSVTQNSTRYQQITSENPMDEPQKCVCQQGTSTTFSSRTRQILGYLTSNPYAAYLEMVQKKKKKQRKSWIELMDVEQIGAICNKDEDAEIVDE